MALIGRKRNEQRRLKKSCKHYKQHSFKNEQKLLCELRVVRKDLLGIGLQNWRCYRNSQKWGGIKLSNLSQIRRAEMLEYLNHLKEIHTDDESRIALAKIETALTEKKYGLWNKIIWFNYFPGDFI